MRKWRAIYLFYFQAEQKQSLAMKLYTALLVLALIIGAVRCQIDWAHLTAHELEQLSPEVFTNITAAQLVSIPTHAFHGWQTDQVQKIPADVFHQIKPTQLHSFEKKACAGFTVDQMKLPGDLCNNFNPRKCFGDIPPASFAGFDSHCISALTEDLVAEITAAQFAFLSPESLIGFECYQLGKVRSEIFPIISPAQISGFASDGCCFIDYRMHTMKDETLHAMEAHCIQNLNYDAFQNITSPQFSQLTLDAIHGISYWKVIDGNATLWMHLSLDQLINLGAGAWEALADSNLFDKLLFLHGKILVDSLTAQQLSNIWGYKMLELKENIYNHFIKGGSNMYSWDMVKEELHYVNWVKILLLDEHEQDFAQHFTRSVLQEMQLLNIMGIRGVIFGKIDPAAFAAFRSEGLRLLTPDQIGNMTAAQWNGVNSHQLTQAYLYNVVSFIPVEVIPNIDPAHMTSLTTGTIGGSYSAWMCQQILSITEKQVAAFPKQLADNYRIDLARCIGPVHQTQPSSSSPTSVIHTPSIATPTGQQISNSSIGIGGVFAIILGCFAGLEAGLIGYYFYRKSRAVQYQAL